MENTNEISIEINSFLEIPLAYQKAIDKYIIDNEDSYNQIWDGSIELLRIDFKRNFRSIEYICIFEIR